MQAATISALRNIVGPANCLTSPEERIAYSYDATAMMSRQPLSSQINQAFLRLLQKIQEVQETIEIIAREKAVIR